MDKQTSPQALMETPTPTTDWNAEAGRVLAFIRKYGLITAVDKDTWLYNGSSESQLAAFLRDSAPKTDVASQETL